jgi:hypothetical protein
MIDNKGYIPKTADEVVDLLTLILYKSPTFTDSFFIHRNVETVFSQLNAGLQNIRRKIGEEKYAQLTSLAAATREHFEADPEDSNGQAREGRKLVREMRAIVEREADE